MYSCIFISNMFPLHTSSYYEKFGLVQGGENITFIQKSLIEGIDNNIKAPCTVINKLLVKKNAGRRFIKKTEWSHSAGAKDVSFPYINYPVFSSNLIYYAAKPWLRKAINEKKNDKLLVIAYGLTNYTLQALSYAKKKQNAVTALIIPDLPEHTKDQSGTGMLKIKNIISKCAF